MLCDNEKEFEKIKNKTLNILSRRMHTQKELSQKLSRSGFEYDDIEQICIWAKEYGFIDDEEYARVYITNAINSSNYGIRRIKQALLYKGIDENVIEDIMFEFDVSEKEKLIPLAEKKLGGNFDKKNVDKTMRHFLLKGYNAADIKSAIRNVIDDFECGEDDDIEI